MKFESFMYWLPLFLIIIGWNIWIVIRGDLTLVIWEIFISGAFYILYLWCNYWLGKNKKGEEDYYY